MNRIIIVGCGFPQLSLVRAARALGLFVIGADMNPHAVGVPFCNEFAEVSTGDPEGLSRLVEKTGAKAITTTGSEVALKGTAIAAAKTGLPFYATPETVRRCQEKDAMRAGYEKGGVLVPPFASCTKLEEAEVFAREHGFPLVLKPSRGWGQRGVARVDSDSELVTAFEEAFAHSSAAGLGAVVIESWIEGREFSVNGWIEDGTLVNYCVTERHTVPGKKPLGVMIAEAFPSRLTAEDELLVIEEARRGAKALGHVRGPCYSQVAFGPKGAFLFETAARMGGGFDADVTRLASGVDLYKRIIGVAVGDEGLERTGVETVRHGGAVAKFLVGRPGLVKAIHGLEAAQAVPGVVEVVPFVPVGGRISPLTDSAKRAAYALAHGSTGEQAIERADRALALLQYETVEEATK